MRFAWLFSLFLTSPALADGVTVFAAASLAGPMDEIAEGFERESGHDVTLVYAGSSALARQVEAGAPADLVILASADWMDHLDRAHAIRPETRRDLLTNRLVLIGGWQHSEPLALQELPEALGPRRFALALSEAVPAGIYARQALETLELWDALAPQIVEADNVRAAQLLVAMGAAGYGIVYETDAATEPRVTILAQVSEETHDPIRYPVALTPNASGSAEALLDYLDNPTARATFTGAGFGLADDG